MWTIITLSFVTLVVSRTADYEDSSEIATVLDVFEYNRGETEHGSDYQGSLDLARQGKMVNTYPNKKQVTVEPEPNVNEDFNKHWHHDHHAPHEHHDPYEHHAHHEHHDYHAHHNHDEHHHHHDHQAPHEHHHHDYPDHHSHDRQIHVHNKNVHSEQKRETTTKGYSTENTQRSTLTTKTESTEKTVNTTPSIKVNSRLLKTNAVANKSQDQTTATPVNITTIRTNQTRAISKNRSASEMTSNNSSTVEDRWIWETGTTQKPTTFGLGDRAAFSGDNCASGQVKLGNTCVDKD